MTKPMDDTISRQAAIDAVIEITYDQTALHHGWVNPYYVVNRLKYLPSADLSEYSDKLWNTAYERGKAEAHSRMGKWVYDEERGARGIYAICTACNEMIYQAGGFNYCPNCGARMEESDDD